MLIVRCMHRFSVPHDRLFLDALERDLKREKMGMEPTTTVQGEPAMSFTYDPKRSLYEQFSKAQGREDGEGELEMAVRRATSAASETEDGTTSESGGEGGEASSSEVEDGNGGSGSVDGKKTKKTGGVKQGQAEEEETAQGFLRVDAF